MNHLFTLGAVLLAFQTLGAAPPTLLDIKRELDNHETELRTFEERLHTQENILDSLREQLLDTSQKQRDLVKGNTASIDARMAAHEASLASIMTDLRQLQAQANDSAKAISQFKQKQNETNQNLDSLQEGLTSLLKALQADSPDAGNSYRVQSGDSLEKIARKNDTTVKKLKELNSLTSDRIFIGQQLKLP